MIQKLLVLVGCLVYGTLCFANTLNVYHAKWCANCPSVIKAVQSKEVHSALVKTSTKLSIIDIDKNSNESIWGVPTIQLKNDKGQVIGELIGRVSKGQIINLINNG